MLRLCAVLALCVFTPFAKGETVVVGVIGDFGVAAEGGAAVVIERSVADLMKRWDPDFIVALGDNNYPDGASTTIDANIGQFFAEYIFPYTGAYGPGGEETNRFFPALGNHDWPGTASLAYFALPGNERYYTVRQGPMEFFIINSNADPDGTTATSVQGRWLQAQLGASTARWKLVVLHHPPYSSDAGGAGNPGFRWPFATWGASGVFSGHDHIYARIHTNGIPYFINGLGGHAIDAFGSANSAAAVRYRSDYGAMRLEATESNLICQFVSRSNVVADTFVLGTPMTSPIILAPPLDQTVIAGQTASFDVTASGTALRYQWQRDGTNILNATNRMLTFTNIQIAQEGEYRALVSSGAATNSSRVARLTVARHPIILQQPASITTGPGSNITFRVTADGFGVVRYQWLRDGTEIAGATISNLFLANVQLEDGGGYAARVSDDMGVVTSKVAELTVRARPIVTVHPLSQSGAIGETIVLSCEAVGTLPLSFSWRKNRALITNDIVYGNVSFFTLRNLQPGDAAGYQVGVTNIAGIAVGGISMTGVVSVLVDTDGDHIPDDWESAHALLPDNPADALLDSDGDGQSNLAEYLAGTDPASAADHLTLEARLDSDGMTVIEFRAVSNKTYAIEFCDSLHDGDWGLLRALSAAPTNRAMTFSDRAAENRFYRLVTPNSQK